MKTSIVNEHLTLDELEEVLGQQFRSLRLRNDTDQRTLAQSAGISLSALRNLETGRGVTLRTMLAVVRALDRTEFLNMLAPEPTVSPMQMLKATKAPRQRAYTPRKSRQDA